MTREEAEDLLDDAVMRISEHFEHVQILASRQTENSTQYVARGGGNWYARTGMAQAFLQTDQAQTEADEIRRILPDNED